MLSKTKVVKLLEVKLLEVKLFEDMVLNYKKLNIITTNKSRSHIIYLME